MTGTLSSSMHVLAALSRSETPPPPPPPPPNPACRLPRRSQPRRRFAQPVRANPPGPFGSLAEADAGQQLDITSVDQQDTPTTTSTGAFCPCVCANGKTSADSEKGLAWALSSCSDVLKSESPGRPWMLSTVFCETERQPSMCEGIARQRARTFTRVLAPTPIPAQPFKQVCLSNEKNKRFLFSSFVVVALSVDQHTLSKLQICSGRARETCTVDSHPVMLSG